MFFHSHCWHKIKGSEYAVPLKYKHNKYIYELYFDGSGASGFVEYAYEAKFECCKCKEVVIGNIVDNNSELTYSHHPYKKKDIEKVPKVFYKFEDNKFKRYWNLFS